MPSELVTRDTLRRELMLNAARKPLAVGVGLAVLIAAFALGAAWLAPVAVLFYLGFAASTFFDGNEAERVGQRVYAKARPAAAAAAQARELPSGLSSELVEVLERARAEERRIQEAIAASELPFAEVSVEVDALAQEMERIATRAQTVTAFLAAHEPTELRARLAGLRAGSDGDDEAAQRARGRAADAIQEQLRVGELLASELRRFRAEMEHVIASLGVVHGQLVRISVSFDPRLEEDVAREVRDLRTRVGTMADGLRTATDEVQDPV